MEARSKSTVLGAEGLAVDEERKPSSLKLLFQLEDVDYSE